MRRNRITAGMFGTDETSLKRAVTHFGCDLIEIAHASARKTRRKIDDCLDQGLPVIVCADKWDHWALLSGRDGKDYFWIDSDKRSLVGSSSWKKLRPWLECDGEDKPFYAIALRPDHNRLSRSLVHRMDRAIELLEEKELRSRWGEYVHVLGELFEDGDVPAKDFFADQRELILENATPDAREPRLSRRLDWLGQVADLHDLHLSGAHTDDASRYLARELPKLP